MPIRKEWLPFNPEQVEQAPQSDGAVELGDEAGVIIYIAGTQNLRQLLQQKLQGPEAIPKAKLFRFEEHFMYTMRESELIQQFMRQNKRLPEFNEELL